MRDRVKSSFTTAAVTSVLPRRRRAAPAPARTSAPTYPTAGRAVRRVPSRRIRSRPAPGGNAISRAKPALPTATATRLTAARLTSIRTRITVVLVKTCAEVLRPARAVSARAWAPSARTTRSAALKGAGAPTRAISSTRSHRTARRTNITATAKRSRPTTWGSSKATE